MLTVITHFRDMSRTFSTQHTTGHSAALVLNEAKLELLEEAGIIGPDFLPDEDGEVMRLYKNVPKCRYLLASGESFTAHLNESEALNAPLDTIEVWMEIEE